MALSFDLSVYLVTDPDLAGPRGVVETVKAAAAGGVTMVQLRDHGASTRQLVETAEALLAVLRPRGIPLIINDRADVMLAVDADGLHVGQSDMPAALARELIGPGRILGLSVTGPDDLDDDELEVVDYLGVGPVFATSTKPNAAAPIGFVGLADLVAEADVPVVAIGGLKAEHVAPVIEAGAHGLAVVSAIMAAPDPASAARDFVARIEAARG